MSRSKFFRHFDISLLSFLAILIFSQISFAKSLASKNSQPQNIKSALNSPNDKRCQDAYKKIIKDGVIKIRLVFGYKDTRPGRFVGDRHERVAFVKRILKPCQSHRQDCGFTRHPDNADLFFKTVSGPKNKTVKVELFVSNSSVGSDDLANRQDPFQKWQSEYAKKAFFGGIEKADIAFYNGHSRFGGGPDFAPPHLTEKSEPNVKLYQTERPGFQVVMEKLKVRSWALIDDSELALIGLFSCASSQHFADSIASEYGVGVISNSSLIYYADALENSLASISSILEMRCEKDFKSLIKHDSPLKGAQIQSFF